MSKILLIETASPQRHALAKLLVRASYEVVIAEDFEAGLTYLNNPNQASSFSAIVVGWPDLDASATDEVLAMLSEPPYNEIPLLILANDADSAKLSWVSGRMQCAFLLWDNYEDSVRTLTKLFSNKYLPTLFGPNDDTPIRVLLVDDSPTARVKFRRLLESCGYHTITASSAKEAIEKATETKFDIAIIDYFMPDDNGDVLCHQLRTNPKTASIIPAVLTSTYSDKVIQGSLSAGAVECMFKNEADDLFKARVDAISRSIRINKRIEQERIRLDGILGSVGDGVYGVNQEGNITFINKAAKTILGIENDVDVIGIHPCDLFHKYSGQQNNVTPIDRCYLEQAIKEGKELLGIETIFTARDQTPIQVELTIFPLRIDGEHQGAVVAFRDVSVRKLLEDELKWQANHDALTKLLNRKYLEEAIENEVRRLHRSIDQSALLYIDLDRFKYINDTIGHAAGDRLLTEIGQLLQTRLRKADLLGRLGGDEFGILLRTIDENSIAKVAEIFRELLAKHEFIHEGRSYRINASIGVALIDRTSQSAEEILANADMACHMAKNMGRNQTHIYTAENDNKAAMDMELGWSVRLHQALEKDSFELYYQPILPLNELDLNSLPEEKGTLWEYLFNQGEIKQHIFELLLRLHNNYGDPISPNAFLPTAERFNMMRDIDGWVINEAMSKMAQLSDYYNNVTFTINLSGQSLDPGNLVPIFNEGIKKWNLDPQAFLFEITESCAINDAFSACNIITDLTNLGCQFALDDFGSGYCSFSHLKRLPVDYIKIDGMFVKDIVNDPMDMAIVRSITNIAHTLGKKTIAEFVESREVLHLLKDCGVDYVQGYYISKPMSALPLTLPSSSTKEQGAG